MADLKGLINAIDINDLAFQLLTHGNTNLAVRGKKDKYLEVTFQSDQRNIYKEAIIIWVDKDKLKDAFATVNQPPTVKE